MSHVGQSQRIEAIVGESDSGQPWIRAPALRALSRIQDEVSQSIGRPPVVIASSQQPPTQASDS
jgi:hypothetical protein